MISALRSALVDSIAAYLQMRYISHLYLRIIVKSIQQVDKQDNRYRGGQTTGRTEGRGEDEMWVAR